MKNKFVILISVMMIPFFLSGCSDSLNGELKAELEDIKNQAVYAYENNEMLDESVIDKSYELLYEYETDKPEEEKSETEIAVQEVNLMAVTVNNYYRASESGHDENAEKSAEYYAYSKKIVDEILK